MDGAEKEIEVHRGGDGDIGRLGLAYQAGGGDPVDRAGGRPGQPWPSAGSGRRDAPQPTTASPVKLNHAARLTELSHGKRIEQGPGRPLAAPYNAVAAGTYLELPAVDLLAEDRDHEQTPFFLQRGAWAKGSSRSEYRLRPGQSGHRRCARLPHDAHGLPSLSVRGRHR